MLPTSGRNAGKKRAGTSPARRYCGLGSSGSDQLGLLSVEDHADRRPDGRFALSAEQIGSACVEALVPPFYPELANEVEPHLLQPGLQGAGLRDDEVTLHIGQPRPELGDVEQVVAAVRERRLLDQQADRVLFVAAGQGGHEALALGVGSAAAGIELL